MKMRLHLIIGLILVLGTALQAQKDKCGTMLYDQYMLSQYPQLAAIRKQARVETRENPKIPSFHKLSSAVITIPVVVHVVYNTPLQNISDAQIQSQITVLNNDYRKLNADTTLIPLPWRTIAADVGIEFCLAKKDPAGNDTNGITRTSTTVTQFNYDNQVKKTSTKGQDPWDPTKYLNLWVCNLGTSLYGFAQFPSDFSTSPSTDGVVINYTAFGTSGAAKAPSNKGRTATHEIAHWIDLYHIWGDDGGACTGDDFISDTPNQASAHYGCTLTYPFVDACSPSTPGIMFMNYMDYGDDQCLVMFTKDQATRMINTLNTTRSAMLNTTICSGPSSVPDDKYKVPTTFSVYPIPSNGLITLSSIDPVKELVVYNVIGESVFYFSPGQYQAQPIDVDLSDRPAGVYFVKILTGKGYSTQKVILER